MNKQQDVSEVEPYASEVLIEQIPPEKKGSIFVPSAAVSTGEYHIFRVLKVGPKCTDARPGDVVIKKHNAGYLVFPENERYCLINEAHIAGRRGVMPVTPEDIKGPSPLAID